MTLEQRTQPRKARRPRRGQNVVRPADIVADGLGRVGAQEDRARMGDRLGEPIGIGHAKLQMLGRNPVRQLRRLHQVTRHDHRTEIAPARAALS